MVNNKEIGKRLKELRGHLTQKELAQKLDCSQNYLSKMENGLILPHLNSIVKYCDTFDVSIEWLVYGNADKYFARSNVSADTLIKITEIIKDKNPTIQSENLVSKVQNTIALVAQHVNCHDDEAIISLIKVISDKKAVESILK